MKRFVRMVFERPKWKLYRKIIQEFLENDYHMTSVKNYQNEKNQEKKIVVLRHDVDNDPQAALIMANIEKELGVSSTYYFRWKTANPIIVKEIAKNFEIGLHYESLAKVLANESISDKAFHKAEALLEQEIQAFEILFGKLYSIASHGHKVNILTKTTNYQLITDEFREKHDLIEAYDLQDPSMLKISDGDSVYKFWKYNISPFNAIKQGAKRIYFLSHPCHWNRTFVRRLITRMYHEKYQVWV